MDATETGIGIAALLLGPGGILVSVAVGKIQRERDREEYKKDRTEDAKTQEKRDAELKEFKKEQHEAYDRLWHEIHDAKQEFRKGLVTSELDRSEIRGRVKVLEDRK